MIPRHHDRVDAGGIGRAQARAEIARILDAVEHEQPYRTAAIDHVSLACTGFHAYRARFSRANLEWREFLVPGTTLWQLFVYDPSGVQLELTFEGSAETGPPPDMSPGRAYQAGQSFLRTPPTA